MGQTQASCGGELNGGEKEVPGDEDKYRATVE